MCTGDLGGDVEAKPQALLARPRRTSEERLEQVLQRDGRYGLPAIGDGQIKKTALRSGVYADGFSQRPMGHGIAEKVRKQLAYPPTVTIDRKGDGDINLDGTVRECALQFFDDLTQGWLDGSRRIARQG